MIANISTDPAERTKILGLTGIIFAGLFLYAVLWTKFRMRLPVFSPVPMDKVLAMENPMYYRIRRKKGIFEGGGLHEGTVGKEGSEERK